MGVNKPSTNKTIILLGAVGSVASIVGLLWAFQGGNGGQSITQSGSGNSIQSTQVGTVQGDFSITNPSEANARGEFNVPTNLYGLTYHEARRNLLLNGWIPNEHHWLYGDSVNVQSGNGPEFWEAGYTELDSCSGTGYAFCKFEFFDPSRRKLVVITQGEEYKDGPHATVARVYFEDTER